MIKRYILLGIVIGMLLSLGFSEFSTIDARHDVKEIRLYKACTDHFSKNNMELVLACTQITLLWNIWDELKEMNGDIPERTVQTWTTSET